MICLWEILIPTKFKEAAIPSSWHWLWDDKVRTMAGGLTILTPVKGQWISTNELVKERMIPVRIACTKEQIEEIARLTIAHYHQK